MGDVQRRRGGGAHGVGRLVNVSSETVPGFFFPERPFLADYAPVDEEHPVRPQDPYALSKRFGESSWTRSCARSDVRALSIRPSWVQWEGNVERNLGPVVRSRGADPSRVLLVLDRRRRPRRGAAPGGRERPPRPRGPLHRRRPTTPAACRCTTSSAATTATPSRCARSTGPTRRGSRRPRRGGCWGGGRPRERRDLLDDDGRLTEAARDRLERGDTAVQRGRAATA